MKHISLFSGIGGPDLAAEWMGWENVSHTEWNAFGQRVLNYYWPNATQHHDITKTDYTIYRGRVDILTGGFPCQGFSLAGKRLGTDDDRYLWPEMRRAYQECRPRVIIGENVTGLISMEDKSGVCRDVFPKVEGRTIVRTLEADQYDAVYTRQATMLINNICKDLEEDGYGVIPFVIPAASVGAPHKRDRVWIIAYAHGNGYGCHNRAQQTRCPQKKSENFLKKWQRVRSDFRRIGTKKNVANPANPGIESVREPKIGTCEFGIIAYAGSIALQNGASERNASDTKEKRSGVDNRAERHGNIKNAPNPYGSGRKKWHFSKESNSTRYGSRRSFKSRTKWDNFPTQSPICDGNDGVSARLDTETIFEGFEKPLTYSKWRNESIKAGGNAIVPQVIYEIFKVIDRYEKEL